MSSSLLLKVRIWTKIVLLVLLLVYLLLFVVKNGGQYIDLWLAPWTVVEQINIFVALIVAFLLGSLLTLLLKTILNTVTQIRRSRARGREQRLEREIGDMKTKTAQMQSRKS